MTIYLGIDPGASGALAWLEGDELTIRDMPATAQEVAEWLVEFPNTRAAIEIPAAMPNQSSSTTAKQFRHVGELVGMLTALRISFVEVTPQKWQKAVGVPSKKTTDKVKPSVKVAQNRWPLAEFTGPRGGAKDGRADAALIAQWLKSHP